MRMPAVFILVGMVSVFAAGPAQAEPVFNSSITYIGAANDPNYHNWRLEVTNDSLEDIPPNYGKAVTAYAENTSDVNFPVPPMDANMRFKGSGAFFSTCGYTSLLICVKERKRQNKKLVVEIAAAFQASQ